MDNNLMMKHINKVNKTMIIILWVITGFYTLAPVLSGNIVQMLKIIILYGGAAIVSTIFFQKGIYTSSIKYIITISINLAFVVGLLSGLSIDYTGAFLVISFTLLYMEKRLYMVNAGMLNIGLIVSHIFMPLVPTGAFLASFTMIELSLIILFFVAKWSRRVLMSSIEETTKSVQSNQKLQKVLDTVKGTSEQLNGTATQTKDISQKMFSSTCNYSTSMNDLQTTVDEIGKSMLEVTENISSIAYNTGVTSKSSREIDTSAEEIANKTNEVSNSIVNVMDYLKQINKSSEEISKNSQIAREQGKETESAAFIGKNIVLDTVKEMEKITEAINIISENIKALDESSYQIGQIIEVIDDITDQTNLLSLNASIEAARAGEHGYGFAVVATAIGKLAEKSSISTKEISKIIKQESKIVRDTIKATDNGVAEVVNGVNLVKKSGDSFQIIYSAIIRTKDLIEAISDSIINQQQETAIVLQSVSKVNELSSDVSNTAEKQLISVNSITQAIDDINKKTQNVAAACQQISASTQEINATTESLVDISRQLVSGSEETSNGAEKLTLYAEELQKTLTENFQE